MGSKKGWPYLHGHQALPASRCTSACCSALTTPVIPAHRCACSLRACHAHAHHTLQHAGRGASQGWAPPPLPATTYPIPTSVPTGHPKSNAKTQHVNFISLSALSLKPPSPNQAGPIPPQSHSYSFQAGLKPSSPTQLTPRAQGQEPVASRFVS